MTEEPGAHVGYATRERLVVALWFVVAIAALLRPTPRWIAETLPDNQGDTSLVIWIMSWGWHGLRHPFDLFDANIFWPHGHSYAYNDTLLALVPPYAVLRGLFGMVAALNLLLIGLFALNLVAIYVLARYIGASRLPAALCSTAFAFSAYPMSHFGHVNLLAFGFVPLSLLAFFRTLEHPNPRRIAGTVVATGAAFTCSAYYGVMLGIAFAATLAVFMLRRQTNPERLAVLGGAVAVAVGTLLVLSPILVAYVHVRDLGLKRDPTEVHAGSLQWSDLAVPAAGNRLWASRLPHRDNPVERRLFPGMFSLALGVLGVAAIAVPGMRRRLSCLRPGPVLSLALAGLALLVLSFGRLLFGRRAPFGFLQDYVPGFDAVRVPARLASVAVLALVIVASLGLTFLVDRIGPRRRWLLLGVCALVVGAESLTTLVHAPLDDGPDFTAPYRMLECADDGVVLELPITDVSTVAGAIVEAPREALSTIDWHRRINGYSGFIPPGYQEDRAVLERFPGEDALARARELGVRYVIVHYGVRNNVGLWSEDVARGLVGRLEDPSVAVRAGDAYVVPLDDRASASLRSCQV